MGILFKMNPNSFIYFYLVNVLKDDGKKLLKERLEDVYKRDKIVLRKANTTEVKNRLLNSK